MPFFLLFVNLSGKKYSSKLISKFRSFLAKMKIEYLINFLSSLTGWNRSKNTKVKDGHEA